MHWADLLPEEQDMYMAQMIEGKSPPNNLDAKKFKDEHLMVHIGSVIKKYREKKKLDQKRFAELMKKKASHVSVVESGEKMFTVVDLVKAVNLLKIPLEELFSY